MTKQENGGPAALYSHARVSRALPLLFNNLTHKRCELPIRVSIGKLDLLTGSIVIDSLLSYPEHVAAMALLDSGWHPNAAALAAAEGSFVARSKNLAASSEENERAWARVQLADKSRWEIFHRTDLDPAPLSWMPMILMWDGRQPLRFTLDWGQLCAEINYLQ